MKPGDRVEVHSFGLIECGIVERIEVHGWGDHMTVWVQFGSSLHAIPYAPEELRLIEGENA